uniref:Charged multivesicular body protein 7 n=2 Tax=Rhizophora mucronata TaxID=61149 RepID=A0A2P2IHC0_RHIMU
MESVPPVSEFIRKEVPDWDEVVIATARFKAFSGQRSDWEPKYQFWRDLILKTARHLGLLTIRPSQVKNEWFNRGGLTPLCLDHVFYLMYCEGDVVRSTDIGDTRSGRLSQLLSKARNFIVRSIASPEAILEDHLVLTALLKERAENVVELLSQSHWTSSCIVSMKSFHSLCGGLNEAHAVLSYLSGIGKARYFSTHKKEFIEGIKVSLSPASVSTISSLDYDLLHLIWTTEKLQQQIDVIDQRYEMSRKLAIASLNSGNKTTALRHARLLKLASESREKCTSLLNRVEEVLNVIANAESTKKVSEAIKIGAQAMKQNRITVEEVENCLDELEESIDSQKQVEKALESAPFYVGAEEEDIEEEFKKLQSEVGNESPELPIPTIASGTPGQINASESTNALTDVFSNLELQDVSTRRPVNNETVVPSGPNDSKHVVLEAS